MTIKNTISKCFELAFVTTAVITTLTALLLFIGILSAILAALLYLMFQRLHYIILSTPVFYILYKLTEQKDAVKMDIEETLRTFLPSLGCLLFNHELIPFPDYPDISDYCTTCYRTFPK